jgi:hypothetical protein
MTLHSMRYSVSQQVKFYIINMVNKKALYIMFLVFETTCIR